MSHGLILDCDGVLVDAEQTAHLRAFNQAWAELGVAWEWTPASYARALGVAGGKERLLALCADPAFRQAASLPDECSAWVGAVERWHRRKTEIYVELVRSAQVAMRPGVRRLAEEARRRGWKLAVCSSGAPASVEAVVERVLGAELAATCALVTGESVQRKKPAPDAYQAAAREVGVAPARCVVVEDCRNGLLAAVRARMTCVVTPTLLTFYDDFSEAALVVSSLGEPAGPPVVVLGGRRWGRARRYVDVDCLSELLSLSRPRRSAARERLKVAPAAGLLGAL